MNIPATPSITLNFMLLRIETWCTVANGATASSTVAEVGGSSGPTGAEAIDLPTLLVTLMPLYVPLYSSPLLFMSYFFGFLGGPSRWYYTQPNPLSVKLYHLMITGISILCLYRISVSFSLVIVIFQDPFCSLKSLSCQIAEPFGRPMLNIHAESSSIILQLTLTRYATWRSVSCAPKRTHRKEQPLAPKLSELTSTRLPNNMLKLTKILLR